jgi:hypothetical protein
VGRDRVETSLLILGVVLTLPRAFRYQSDTPLRRRVSCCPREARRGSDPPQVARLEGHRVYRCFALAIRSHNYSQSGCLKKIAGEWWIALAAGTAG